MTISKEALATIKVYAFTTLRYVSAMGASAIGVAAMASDKGIISPTQAQSVSDSWSKIEQGGALIWQGASNPYFLGCAGVGLGMMLWGLRSTSPAHAASIVADTIPNTTIVTTPKVACATPNQPNIVSNEEHVVVGLS